MHKKIGKDIEKNIVTAVDHYVRAIDQLVRVVSYQCYRPGLIHPGFVLNISYVDPRKQNTGSFRKVITARGVDAFCGHWKREAEEWGERYARDVIGKYRPRNGVK